MSRTKVKLNKSQVREYLKDDSVAELCREYAEEIASRAGAGYAVSVQYGKNRVWATAYPATPEAVSDNLENNTLLKAIGGG